MTIPANLRSPTQATDVDNSQASQGPALQPYRALIIGQKLSGGGGTANTLYRVATEADIIAIGARGSMLHTQGKSWLDVNRATELWVAPVADNGAGVAATGSVQFTGTATADGTIALYAGGKLITIGVASGEAATAIATAFAALMPSGSDFPATAAVDGTTASKVNVTYRHKGLVGNDYDLRVNYQHDEALPAGITVAVTPMASGATNPVLTSLITAMGDRQFHVIVHPYTDATSLTALENEMSRRFGPLVQIPGVMFTGSALAYSSLASLGEGRNSPHSVIFGTTGCPTPPCEVAAQAAGVIAPEASADPARPFQTLELPTVLAPVELDDLPYEERNLLLFDGIATLKAGPGRVMQIDRAITTYQLSASSAADDSYLDATTLFTLMYLRFSWKTLVSNLYPRHKLANDGTRVGPGQKVVTPKQMKGTALGWFRQMEKLALVEGFDQFKQDLTIVRPSDPSRLDSVFAPDLINGFIVGATTFQFKL